MEHARMCMKVQFDFLKTSWSLGHHQTLHFPDSGVPLYLEKKTLCICTTTHSYHSAIPVAGFSVEI